MAKKTVDKTCSIAAYNQRVFISPVKLMHARRVSSFLSCIHHSVIYVVPGLSRFALSH